ncbi:MAG: hypothetical protein ABI155_04155 [Paralcaligenes sp.]
MDYRHVIEALVKKPRAFRYSQMRDELLPSQDYQMIWEYVDRTLAADTACQYIVRLLHLAKKTDSEGAIGRYVLGQLATTSLPSMIDCEDRFLEKRAMPPRIAIHQHALSDYDSLLKPEAEVLVLSAVLIRGAQAVSAQLFRHATALLEGVL